jgi:hypothetical protein
LDVCVKGVTVLDEKMGSGSDYPLDYCSPAIEGIELRRKVKGDPSRI